MNTICKLGMSILIILLLAFIVIATSTNWDSEVFRINGNISTNQYHADAWYHNHTATQLNFAVDGVYYNLTFSDYHMNGFTNGTNHLIVGVEGEYFISYMASGDGQNNHVYFTSMTVNGVVQDVCEAHKKMAAGGDITTMTGSCTVSLSVNDELRLVTADIGGTGTGNYYSNSLTLFRVGD